jgi:uncharacterized protein with HEPN domain
MSSRKPNLYLHDILQACDDILNFMQAIHSADELQNDRKIIATSRLCALALFSFLCHY